MYGDVLTGREAAVWTRLRGRIQVEGCEGGAVLPSAPCWVWTGTWDNRWAVGKVWVWGKTRTVHRFLFELFLGEVPDGHTLIRLDLCGGGRCVNPAHYTPVPRWLEQASKPTTLTARMLARTHCVHGHEYTDESTGYLWFGQGRRVTRYCKTCRRDQWRRRKGASDERAAVAP